MDNTDGIEQEYTGSTEPLINLSQLSRYANATIYTVQKALQALDKKPVNISYNKNGTFYPDSVKDAVKKWIDEN